MQQQKHVSSLHLGIVDFDLMFSTLTRPPVIVNDVDVISEESKDQLNELILSQYESDTLSVMPTCDCGTTHGGDKLGRICLNCHTPVLPVTEHDIEPRLWIRAPDSVRALINPAVWTILREAFKKKTFSVLDWLVDPGYKGENSGNYKNTPYYAHIKALNPQRGLNAFVEQFHQIMDHLLDPVYFRQAAARRKRDDIRQFIDMYGDRFFCQALPIPSKIAFIVESGVTGRHADDTMIDAMNAIRTISSIKFGFEEATPRKAELRAMKAIQQLSNFYNQLVKTNLSGKPGWFRKHIYGTRQPFSFRAVISSRSDNHKYWELELPWTLSISLLKIHLTSKLYRRGFTPNQATGLLMEYATRFHPLINELFKELIAEAPHGGIPVIFQRNPTLARGSAQRYIVTKIKEDPGCNTVTLSVLTLKPLNADFDGDALNGMIMLDEKMYAASERLGSHTSVLDLEVPRTISNTLALPPPVISTLSRWMFSHD